ncbi:maleylpyruvate isomerase family mycothiol-dependent enzyme [Plantactinospora sp. GCM10030261]|uniref:maleylpyruvate isomerase family mycothiol-dependent enzyme n=1 Tax=Plantactinospora sp. GCM10030261 TaxID=3273420 RepID=UPI0036217C92
MLVYDMVVDERRRMADLLAGLTEEQLRQRSLCAGWTVHDVAAHLVTYLRYGQAKILFAIVATGADFDRFNVALTRRAARIGSDEIIARLRRQAAARTTIPRSGYDPVLTDLLLHDLDIRVPLGIPRDTPEERLRVAFHHLAVAPSPGFAMGGRLAGLRLRATDTGWAYGRGALVAGRADALVLGMAGRSAAFADLDGDGVALLRQRVGAVPRPGPLHRLMAPLRVLAHPPPPERRSRRAVAPPRPE